MLMVPSTWEFLSLACKLLTYLGAASLLGALFCIWLFKNETRQVTHNILTYMTVGAFLGFQGSLFGFLVQIGMVVNNGPIGMFDRGIGSIYLDSPLGDTTFFQLSGFALTFILGLTYANKIQRITSPPRLDYFRFFNTGCILAFLLLIFSFRFSGHISILSVTSKLSIAAHYSAFAAWIGSLYPLYCLSFSENLEYIQDRVKKFGDSAVALVAVLIVAGGLMVIELFDSIAEAFSTKYGQIFLIKLSLVVLILAIAAINRLRLTPRLVSKSGVVLFRQSLKVEILVALLILSITTYFSTIVGPPEH